MLRFHPQAMLRPPKSPLAASQSQRSKLDTHRRGRGRFINSRKREAKVGTAAISRKITSIWIGMSLLLSCTLYPYLSSIRNNHCNSSTQVFENGVPLGLLIIFPLPWHLPVFSWRLSPPTSPFRLDLSRGGKWFWSPWTSGIHGTLMGHWCGTHIRMI